MKCFHCHGDISKAEQSKMVCEYKQPDGSLVPYGLMQPAGKIADAKGTLFRAYMWRCWNVVIKRNARGGDPVSGRGIANAPTAYNIGELIAGKDEHSTAFLTAQNDQRLTIARQLGVASDSWEMRELMRAVDKGVARAHRPDYYMSDGYLHTHRRPVEKAGLVAHLKYAHGHPDQKNLTFLNEETLRRLHDRAHVEMAAKLIDSSRQADPGSVHDEGPELEWPGGPTSTVEL